MRCLPMIEASCYSVYAARWAPAIDAALAGYVAAAADCPERLREAIAYSLLAPGKRLRPMLVVLAAEACGGSIDAAMPAACAVEMVHAYSLVHDDLPAMDDDDLRRGRPTCHRRFDEATAILVGDALLAMAFAVLANDVRPPEAAARCCRVLAEASGPCGLVGGQADDLAGFAAGADLDRLESMHRRKTGALIRASLRLGALTAGADPAAESALDRYGDQAVLYLYERPYEKPEAEEREWLALMAEAAAELDRAESVIQAGFNLDYDIWHWRHWVQVRLLLREARGLIPQAPLNAPSVAPR